MATPANPFTDHAVPVLQNATGIDDAARADLHDIFHDSKDANELAQRLQPLAVPDQVKSDLYDTKKRIAPTGAVSKATEAVTAMSQLDPKVLELAETHPKMAAAFIATATKEQEKGPEAAQAAPAASKPTSEGKPAPAEPAAPAAAAAPGPAEPLLPGDLPPIPDDHHRILASDGGIHDIPKANLKKARQIDPRLHVMNP